jgi:Bardet-Biedl syndrome 9 protein
MCKGSFGSLYNPSPSKKDEIHEYICVQSMDGMLTIYEYESESASCFLPNCLIPGPLKYVPKTDSFVTVGSTWQLESYKYQTLATSSKATYESSSSPDKKGIRKILPEYQFNLGECAIDIEVHTQLVHNTGQSVCCILVLGERNLHCLTETCSLLFIKKFDFNPSCFCSYSMMKSGDGDTNLNQIQSQPPINFIIGAFSKIIFIHEDVKVKWAAQLERVPVQLVVAKINNLNGVVVSLSEDGKLSCSYMGTEPAYSMPIMHDDANHRPFDYQRAEKEYRMLQVKIKEAIMNTGVVISPSMNEDGTGGAIINVNIPKQVDDKSTMSHKMIEAKRDCELEDSIDSIPSITCFIELKSITTMHNIKVVINCQKPIVAVPDSFTYISATNECHEKVMFYMKTKHVPCNLNVNVCATYSHSINGSTRISETKFRLPLKLLMKSCIYQGVIDSVHSNSSDSSIDSKQQQVLLSIPNQAKVCSPEKKGVISIFN